MLLTLSLFIMPVTIVLKLVQKQHCSLSSHYFGVARHSQHTSYHLSSVVEEGEGVEGNNEAKACV